MNSTVNEVYKNVIYSRIPHSINELQCAFFLIVKKEQLSIPKPYSFSRLVA